LVTTKLTYRLERNVWWIYYLCYIHDWNIPRIH